MGRLIKFEDFEMEDKHKSDVAHNTPEPETDTPDTPEDLNDTEPEDLELEEEKLTDKAQGYVSSKIAKLKEEGYPDNQAAAIAFSMAKKRGFDVNDNPNELEIPSENEDDQKIKDTEKTKKRIASFSDHTKQKDGDTGHYHDVDDLVVINDLDEDRDMTKLPDGMKEKAERPLDASYITRAMVTYAEELKDDVDTEEDLEIAIEMRQIGRSMRAEFPNSSDIHLEQVYDIADEQGIEDKEILQKVKDEIKYIWMQV